MRVLFVTRKFPPSIGGMQRVSYDLYTHLSQIATVKLVKWGGSNKWLPLVLPYLYLRSVWMLIFTKIDAIYVQDGLLAPLGLALKLFRKPVAITFHGRDINYEDIFYQFLIPYCARRLDKVVCVSTSIKKECLKRQMPETKTVVIPNGTSGEFYMDSTSRDKGELREELSRIFEVELDSRKLMLSVGRLIEKKGFYWFVDSVLPKLLSDTENFLYLIAGDGTLRKPIEDAIMQHGLERHAVLLGWADDEKLSLLYNASDLYIMPNTPTEGDMEGFGVVAIEAASCCLPVIASNCEGVKDAIKDRENGFLVEPYDDQGFVALIKQLMDSDRERIEFGARARKFTLDNYGWEKVAGNYLAEFSH